jgi:hypothetical protein
MSGGKNYFAASIFYLGSDKMLATKFVASSSKFISAHHRKKPKMIA